MFFLRDIPSRETLEKLADRYTDLDPSALMCCIMLARTGSDALYTFEKILSRFKLSQGGFLTLIVLNRNPEEEITPSDLAEKVGVTRATMTGLLDTLMKDELIQRIQHNDDRRKILIRLTDSGRKRLDTMLPGYYGEISQMIAGLSEDERETLINLLHKVSKTISGVGA